MKVDPRNLPPRYRKQIRDQIAKEDREKFTSLDTDIFPPFEGPENKLQSDVEGFLAASGCDFFHMPGKAAQGNPEGIPDLIVWCPFGKRLNIELKVGKKKLSDVQKAFKKRVEENGHTVHVCRSLAHVKYVYYREVYGAATDN